MKNSLLQDETPKKKLKAKSSLDTLCSAILAKLDEEDKPLWKSWQDSLPGFKTLESIEQQFVIAKGLRLCHMLGGRFPEHGYIPYSESLLHQPSDCLKGIGPKMAIRLSERGLDNVEDLIWLVPRRYDDVRDVKELKMVLEEQPLGERVVLIGTIDTVRFVRRGARTWIDLRMKEDQGSLVVRWFGARSGMCSRYQEGGRAVLAAKLSERNGQLEMTNPDVLALVDANGEKKVLVEGVVPKYSQIPGVPASTIRKACSDACRQGSKLLIEAVPLDICEQLKMKGLAEAVSSLHSPSAELSVVEVRALNEGNSEWHRRLAFEELFVLAATVAKRKQDCRSEEGRGYAALEWEVVQEVFPYTLTFAQKRSIEEIALDLQKNVPMNRLLQGDVGSGKTAIAFAAALQVIKEGGQTVLMSPTTILAEQHFQSLSVWCKASGVRIALLTASTPKTIRTTMLTLLLAGQIDLVVGTHALLAPSVVFHELALVLIDEQHRFGVAQRSQLRAKSSGFSPHLLVMTATPIPRTLALSAYGDLDVSVLDEMPPGRQPTRTHLMLGKEGRILAYRALERRLAKGERAFVICPMVEASEEEIVNPYANATDVAKELQDKFSDVVVALVHGRMSKEERDDSMNAFRSGEASLLVATTVIEVGVDVPEAIVILIEDADHFGLAQLHQLRGRVGRGGGASECVLLCSGNASEEGRERLDILVKTQDGFVISEEDLRMRGPGELLGVRQAGLPRLRFGDLRTHGELLETAKKYADAVLREDPDLLLKKHMALKEVLELKRLEAYGAEGG